MRARLDQLGVRRTALCCLRRVVPYLQIDLAAEQPARRVHLLRPEDEPLAVIGRRCRVRAGLGDDRAHDERLLLCRRDGGKKKRASNPADHRRRGRAKE